VTMSQDELLREMRRLKACKKALDYVTEHPSGSAERIWLDCERADWLLFGAALAGVDRRQLVLAAHACTRNLWTNRVPDDIDELDSAEAAEELAGVAYAAAMIEPSVDAALRHMAGLVRELISWSSVEEALNDR
jgi:hypothetical protein